MKSQETLKNLRSKEIGALQIELEALQKSFFSLRMQKAAQQIKDTNVLRFAKRDIARAQTVLAEKKAALVD